MVVTALPPGICLAADPSDTITPSVLEYPACGLPAGHAHGHRWEPCGAEYVVKFSRADLRGKVEIVCTRRGHTGRHAFEWEAKS